MPLWLDSDLWWMRKQPAAQNEPFISSFQRANESQKQSILENKRLEIAKTQADTQKQAFALKLQHDNDLMTDIQAIQEHQSALQVDPMAPPPQFKTREGMAAYWNAQAKQAQANDLSDVNRMLAGTTAATRFRFMTMQKNGAPPDELYRMLKEDEAEQLRQRGASTFNVMERFTYFDAQNALKAADDRAEDIVKIVTANTSLTDEEKKAEVAKARLSAQREKQKVMEDFKTALGGQPMKQVQSEAEFMALPSGTTVLAPDGKTLITRP